MEKIGIVVPEAKNGGAEKQAIYLMKALSNNYECYYIILFPNYTKEPDWNIFSLNEHTHIVRLSANNEFNRIKEFYRYVKNEGLSYLFCYLTKPDFYGTFVGKIAGIKKVFLGIRNDTLPKWKTILELIANKFSDGIIINNYCGKDKFGKKGFNNITVIPNCYINFHEPQRRESKSLLTVVSVGRFVTQKDYETAIKAFSEAKHKYQNIRYKIVGFGNLETQIRCWIDDYKVSDSVELVIDPPDIYKILSESDIYLCSSLYEGTSNSIMEAMDASLPVIATNVGDNAILVENEISGYIVDKGDSATIANMILDLCHSEEKRVEMGLKGNERLKEFYSIESFREKYLELLEK